MRDTKINAFYYPDKDADRTTLKKAILLFDELHFMDRPAFTFQNTHGELIAGLIGMKSELRDWEALFRSEGVPLYVHPAPGGPIPEELYEQVVVDLNDQDFLGAFQQGLKSSVAFRDLNVAPGNYGAAGDQPAVVRKLIDIDLVNGLGTHSTPVELFHDPHIMPFDLSTTVGCAKNLIFHAATCSAKLNYALNMGTKHGFIPLADATPYGDLLGTKYARAINKLRLSDNQIQLTDLSFAIFDELVVACI